MPRYQGRLVDGQRVVADRVLIDLEDGDGRPERWGRLEIHAGGLFRLAGDRPYHLLLEDGRAEEIRVTSFRSCSGIVTAEFRAR